MKALCLAALCLSAAPLPAESHFALRSVSTVLRQSPAELSQTLVLPGPTLLTVKKRAFEHEWDLQHAQIARWYGGLDGGPLRFEWNLLAQADQSSLAALLPSGLSDEQRLPALQSAPLRKNGLFARTEVDQLNLRLQKPKASLVLGRQPVNFASNFYFSPLDVFGAFAPGEIYREFRPGIDAARLSYSMSPFSLIETVAVAGFEPGKGDWRPEGTSWLGRYQINGNAWSCTVQGGKLKTDWHTGTGLQIEHGALSVGSEASANEEINARILPGGISERHRRVHFAGSLSRQWTAATSGRFEFAQETSIVDLKAPDGSLSSSSSSSRKGVFSLQTQADALWTVGSALFATAKPEGMGWAVQASAERSLSDESVLGLSFDVPIRTDHGPTATESLLSPYRFQIDIRTTL